MKKIFFLIVVLFLIDSISAQHKTLILYYPGDSTNVVSIANLDSMAIFICGASKVNYGGKYYNTVLIGSQCWLKENIDVGIMIQGVDNQINNGVIEKYCYNNDPANCEIFGGLYQWDEAMQYVSTAGAKGICPTDWHIPTLAEFQTLAAAVNNDGNSLKAIGQGVGEGAGTNTSGFSGLLAGYHNNNGNFYYLGNDAIFWISTEYNVWESNYFYLLYNLSNIIFDHNTKYYGFSVRCIKDE